MRAKALIARKIDAPVPRVWEAIARFGRLDVWFPTIATCDVEGTGVGARRTMAHERGRIVDRLDAIEEAERRLTYRRLVSPFAVSFYQGTVEVMESFDHLAVVVWTVDFEAEAEQCAALRAGLEAGIGAGVAGLAADLARQPACDP